MFKISYVLFTGRGDLLDNIVNFGQHLFEEFDYALESLTDLYVTSPDGVPVRLDLYEFLPETVQQTQEDLPNRVFFYLYTRDNPSDGQRLNVNDTDTLQNSNFNVSKYTVIYFHGWMVNYTYQSATVIRDGMRSFIEKTKFF